jgi:CubicO group peptidase (beta-lactamase class C family)
MEKREIMIYRIRILSCRVGFLLALLTIAVSCSAQSEFPNTSAGNQTRAFLDAFNTGDLDKYKQFLTANYPTRLQNVERDMGFRRLTGGFELRKVEESTPTKIVALVQERVSDQFARMSVEIDASDKHQITKFDLTAVRRPADFAIPHLTEDELITTLRKKLDDDATANQFSGSVLISRNNKTIFSQSYGLANREKKIANTLQTRFRIGSMNKMFTAVSTMQLVQSGKLDLKANFGKYLTDYPNQDVSSKVTIEQLLSHMGATGDIFGPDFEQHRLELKTLHDYVALYGKRGLDGEPGTRWRYSNYGFLLLGVIIEKVSGQSYYDYVRDNIFKPAGMTRSGSEPEEQQVEGRSVGYMRSENGEWIPNNDTLPFRGTSAGGGYSTVEDLMKFANALQSHKLLNAQNTELLTTGKVDVGSAKYAYGIQEEVINGTKCFGHGGGAPGMNGSLQICPASGYVVAVLANLDPPTASRVSNFILNRLPTK